MKHMKNKGNMFQSMEQNISPEIIPNEMKVNELPNKGFKRIFLKMFYKLKETVYEQS